MKMIKQLEINFIDGYLKDANGWCDDGEGTQYHFKDGYIHNDNGEPAVKAKANNGMSWEEWWVNGKVHREDGPAVLWNNGLKLWYVHGNEVTESEFNKWKTECDKEKLNKELPYSTTNNKNIKV